MNRIIYLLFIVVIMSSCDGLFEETGCTYYGYVSAQNNFINSEEIPTPAQNQMSMILFPEFEEGKLAYDNYIIPFDKIGFAKDKLLTGGYKFLIYNRGNNILNIGDDISEVSLTTPVKDGLITEEQGFIYSGNATGSIETDDTLHLKVSSEVIVQRIRFNVSISNADDVSFVDISSVLTGVTTSRMLFSRQKGNGFASLPFKIPSTGKNTFSKDVLVFGINNSVANIISLTVNSKDSQFTDKVDLSKILADFTQDGIEIDIELKYDVALKEFTAIIEGWKDLDWGGINI